MLGLEFILPGPYGLMRLMMFLLVRILWVRCYGGCLIRLIIKLISMGIVNLVDGSGPI